MWLRNASLVESHVNYILLFRLLNELISFQSLVPALHVTLTKDESHVPYPVLWGAGPWTGKLQTAKDDRVPKGQKDIQLCSS